MIYEVMKSIQTSQVFSIKKISEDLKIDPAVVEDLILNLVSKGFLKADKINSSSCGSCSLSCSSTCPVLAGEAIKIYSITERGEKFIEKKESTN